MNWAKNKFYIILGVAVLVVIYTYTMRPSGLIQQDKLIDWIDQGYTKQFCTVVYPRLADCMTLTTKQCPDVAKAQISECIAASKDDLPKAIEPFAAKKIYDSFAKCFEIKLHEEVLQHYMVSTPDCIQRME